MWDALLHINPSSGTLLHIFSTLITFSLLSSLHLESREASNQINFGENLIFHASPLFLASLILVDLITDIHPVHEG